MHEGNYKPGVKPSQEIQQITHENESHAVLREFVQNQGFKEAATFNDLIEELQGMQRADFPFTTSDGMRLEIASLITLVQQAAKKEGLFAVSFPSSLITRTGGLREALHRLYETKHTAQATQHTPERVKTPEVPSQAAIERLVIDLPVVQKFDEIKRNIISFNASKPSTQGRAIAPEVVKSVTFSIEINQRLVRTRALFQRDSGTGRLAIIYDNEMLNKEYRNFFD